MEQCERLRQYNRWRRGDEAEQMPDPPELGELLEGVADRLEVLEREHQEFFERWHGERRKREKLELAARNLITVKGRHHTEQAFKMLRDAVEKVSAGETVTEGNNAEVRGASRLAGEASSAKGATSTAGLEGNGENGNV